MTFQSHNSGGGGDVDEPGRESRIPLRFVIEVCGFDRYGKFFTERTETTDVSRRGCRFQLHTEILPETVVAIRVVRKDDVKSVTSPVLFQVAHTESVRDGCSAEAATLQAGDVWSVDFAALDGTRVGPAK
jgi:hypothetical protein